MESDICSDAVTITIGHGTEGTMLKGQALDLPVDLHSQPHLWSRALGNEQKNMIWDASGENKCPL